VLQCAASCGSVLHCAGAVCCSVMRCVAVCWSRVLQCALLLQPNDQVLQCITVCCSVL